MDRSALAAVREHFDRMRELTSHFEERAEIAKILAQDRLLQEEALCASAALQAARDARLHWQQLALDTAHLRAMRDLMPWLASFSDQISAVQNFMVAVAGARELLEGSTGFAWYARESFNAFLKNIYEPSVELARSSADWFDEEVERLLAEDPEYRRSKLAWILVIFVPRFRLALYEQDSEGDFDGVMQALWEDFLKDPDVRARLRERLEKSGVREELRQSLSSHLDKFEEGELMYAIWGLYAHIEGFLAEVAVERGLIPDKETILRSDGAKKRRKGVQDLISVLHQNGQIDDSQKKFLTFVLSNNYQANRLRHGISFEFTQERAVALVLALILILCLAWSVEPGELLETEDSEDCERWIEGILDEAGAK
jgi:hypothetical protein